jgi:hypothetical protein
MFIYLYWFCRFVFSLMSSILLSYDYWDTWPYFISS